MASVVQLCNMALSHIGSDARVISIDPPDGSVEAEKCAQFYDLARTELLEPGSWAFSLKRATLAQVDNPSDTWAFAYAKPAGCLRAVRLLTAAGVTDREGADFEVEAGVILTNEEDAVLVYVTDITDASKFPPSFASALSFLLAGYLAGPIIKGNEGAKFGDAMRQRAMTAAEMSAAASANASSTHTDQTHPSIVTARA